MRRFTLIPALATSIFIGLPVTAPSAQPMPVNAPSVDINPAETCFADLRAFDAQLEEDGHWLSGSGFGFGFPALGSGFGEFFAISARSAANPALYHNARPGYEVRVLLASANVLARHGQQDTCESVLALARDVYRDYVAGLPLVASVKVDLPGWRLEQIATAQSVLTSNTSFRADELLGTEVRNPQNEALGSVDDMVLSPQTGKVAYLVIGRGGLFGIGEKYIPVPWEAFRISPNASLLVLDTTKATMSMAPRVAHDQLSSTGHFDEESRKIDAYWQAHGPRKTDNP